jgi:two-component system OmpR family sensor kinase
MFVHGLGTSLMLLGMPLLGSAFRTRRHRREAVMTRPGHAPEGADAFVRDAAHTLRTPLIVARSHAEFVLAGLEPGTAAHDDALVVLDELRRAARISDQLLLLGAATQAEAPVLAPVALDDLVRTVARRWSGVGGRSISVDAGEGVVALGDEERLRHALDALVENALKATTPEDEVTVGARASGRQAILTVSDSGHGIAAADLEGIFDRFGRGAAPRPGTGLGLAIVRAVAEAHGGHVAVRSAVRRGTTFSLRLPLAPDGEAAPPATADARPGATPPRHS